LVIWHTTNSRIFEHAAGKENKIYERKESRPLSLSRGLAGPEKKRNALRIRKSGKMAGTPSSTEETNIETACEGGHVLS